MYGTHSGRCRQERSKAARELEHKVFCLIWSFLNKVLLKKADNDSPYCFSCVGMSIGYLTSVSLLLICTSQLCSHNLQNMVHYNYLVWFSTLCCPLDAGFRLWEKAVGELKLLSGTTFPNRKWRKPCISTFSHQPEMVPCSALWAPPCIPPPWGRSPLVSLVYALAALAYLKYKGNSEISASGWQILRLKYRRRGTYQHVRRRGKYSHWQMWLHIQEEGGM